jgi:alpha-ketoglutaric semialdehyde dehydrogenase
MPTNAVSALHGLSLVGASQGSGKGKAFHAFDPATGQSIEPAYYSATTEDLLNAAELAAEAFPAFSRTSGRERAAFLRTIAARIEALVESLIERTTQETALPAARVRGETARTCSQLRLFASVIEEGSWVNARIDPALPDRQPAPRPDLRSMLRPIGPVAVFSASNFPLAFSVAGGDTASALAAGNPVIVKAHAAHPGTSELIGQAIRESVQEQRLPEGVFSMLYDAGIEIGTQLVQHPAIQAVGFTGSRAGGDALRKAAAQRPEPIPVYAEMSSTNPVFLLPGALRERSEQIATGLAGSFTLGAGQFCTKPGIVILKKDAQADSFVEKLRAQVNAATDFTLLTAGIQSAYTRGAEQRGKSGSARICAEGPRTDAAGFRVSAVVFETDAQQLADDPTLAEELFGPSTVITKYSTKDELLNLARDLEGHLTATVHGTPEDLREYAELLHILERKVGRLIINGFPTGVEVSHAMVHGGPYPSTSDSRSTSVGSQAIFRFARPVCYQGFPDEALPDELKNANPLGIWRLLDGAFTRDPLA